MSVVAIDVSAIWGVWSLWPAAGSQRGQRGQPVTAAAACPNGAGRLRDVIVQLNETALGEPSTDRVGRLTGSVRRDPDVHDEGLQRPEPHVIRTPPHDLLEAGQDRHRRATSPRRAERTCSCGAAHGCAPRPLADVARGSLRTRSGRHGLAPASSMASAASSSSTSAGNVLFARMQRRQPIGDLAGVVATSDATQRDADH